MKTAISMVVSIIICLTVNIMAYDKHECLHVESGGKMHCPMMIEGARVVIQKIENGVGITVVADKEELIKKIKEEAKVHQKEVAKNNSMYMCSVEEKDCEDLCICLIEGAEMIVIEKDDGVDIKIISNDKEIISKIQKKADEVKEHHQSDEKG